MNAIVERILKDPRARDRIVVLCEGDLPDEAKGQRRPLSPQSFRDLRVKPDATFYRSCFPRHGWPAKLKVPEFYNCGGRSHVVQAFRDLSARSQGSRNKAYCVDRERLYAFVDLDVQTAAIDMPGYRWTNTEDIHDALYTDGQRREQLDADHRVWVSALIHKEAFFVLPGIDRAWSHHPVQPHFEGHALDLRRVHEAVARSLRADEDVAANLATVQARMQRFDAAPHLDTSSGDAIMNSWLAHAVAGQLDYEGLVRALLAVGKVKPQWSRVVPEPGKTNLAGEVYRDQLANAVAAEISKAPPHEHPIAGFFAFLAERHG